MDFGVTGKLGGYYPAGQYRKNAAGKSDGVDFAELAAAKAAERGNASGMSFKDMWQSRFPGAYYHVMDGSKISQGAWDRNDFPLDKFFQDDTDASAVNWKPTGAEPEATSSQVQSRWNSTLGQKSIIVPPELEEKMKNDPELAKKVMANVENFITTYTATSVRPGRVCSWLISLDENGEIEKFRVTGGGGNISGPTEEEMRQFEAEQAAKKKRREEYARLNEESALKRKLMEQETDARYYQTSITKRAASVAAYEAAGILK
ncbi:hypothetical protein [Eisenbergiella tayi]|uniref:hypothetical protein n=1 Tax=Eisenbergiella tayi TaxID=1432052 RepID=UPI0024325BAE|nr:hypothetical protein [Eisenbergiella tayi]